MNDVVEMNIHRLGKLEYQAAEAIKTLATNLSFSGDGVRKLLITSCHTEEGKSFVSINLMRAMASQGMRVALVDADIRTSALQDMYGIDIGMPDNQRYKGLTGYLAGQCEMDEIIAQTNIPGACMILAGSTVSNSLRLFNTQRMAILLDSLSKSFDIVLVDVPPVHADAARLASLCDGVLFVVRAGVNSVSELKEAAARIEKSGCSIVGYVMNRFDEKQHGDRYTVRNPRHDRRRVKKKKRSIFRMGDT